MKEVLSLRKKSLQIDVMIVLILYLSYLVVLSIVAGFGLIHGRFYPVATFLGFVCGGIYILIGGVARFTSDFDMAIGCGRTRKSFVAAYYVVNFLEGAVFLGAIFALLKLETVWMTGLFHVKMYDIMPDIKFVYLIGLAAAVLTIEIFCGAILLRFGAKGMWVLWAIWMVGCFVLPSKSIQNSQVAQSIVTMLQQFYQNVGTSGVVGIAVAVVIVLHGIAWGLLRKQGV